MDLESASCPFKRPSAVGARWRLAVSADMVLTRAKVGTVENRPPAEGESVARPRVAIMNSGATKGGTAPAWQVEHHSPGIPDIWHLHYAVNAGKLNNASDPFIANPDQSANQGKWVKLWAESNGTFTVTNTQQFLEDLQALA